jgi:hypothetical protein
MLGNRIGTEYAKWKGTNVQQAGKSKQKNQHRQAGSKREKKKVVKERTNGS